MIAGLAINGNGESCRYVDVDDLKNDPEKYGYLCLDILEDALCVAVVAGSVSSATVVRHPRRAPTRDVADGEIPHT
jgi:hypothetical protein